MNKTTGFTPAAHPPPATGTAVILEIPPLEQRLKDKEGFQERHPRWLHAWAQDISRPGWPWVFILGVTKYGFFEVRDHKDREHFSELLPAALRVQDR